MKMQFKAVPDFSSNDCLRLKLVRNKMPTARIMWVLLTVLFSCIDSFQLKQYRTIPASRQYMSMVISTAPPDTTVLVAGATGYIGKFVVSECVRQGYKTLALTRSADTKFDGAEIIVTDVTNIMDLQNVFRTHNVDAIICCLASRSGTRSDSYLIDYQKAKLKFEAELVEEARKNMSTLGYTIVRPTAFFKSVSGQLEIVKAGLPFVVFGDGSLCRCNPIAEADLARFMVDSLKDPSRQNQIINIGGPDEGYTMEEQGKLLAAACKVKPNIFKAPIALFDIIIGTLDGIAKIFPNFEDAAEQARIGKYYAVENMLTLDPSEKYGTITLKEHYEKIAVEGQEYDPYTAVFGSKSNA